LSQPLSRVASLIAVCGAQFFFRIVIAWDAKSARQNLGIFSLRIFEELCFIGFLLSVPFWDNDLTNKNVILIAAIISDITVLVDTISTYRDYYILKPH